VTVRRRIVPLAACLLVAAACSSGGKGGPPFQVRSSPVPTDRVDLPKTLRYAPDSIEVPVGTTVTWTNHDNLPHTVKLLDGSEIDKPLPIGGTTTIRFTKTGTIYYLCSIHPQMHAKVVVVP
jgi:plastocyanin